MAKSKTTITKEKELNNLEEVVTASVEKAVEMSIPPTDGLPIEETLSSLW